MPWLATAIPIAMAAHSTRMQVKKNKQNERDRVAKAEVDRWSPWTNIKSESVGEDRDVLGAAGAGYAQGTAFAQQLPTAQKATAAPDASVSEAVPSEPLPSNITSNPGYFENEPHLAASGYFESDVPVRPDAIERQTGFRNNQLARNRQPSVRGSAWDYDPRKGY